MTALKPVKRSMDWRSLHLLAALSLVILTGCATSGDYANESDIPWNAPEPWEGSPYFPGMNQY